jgi:ABC-type multidrug transport system fused ATPase/permease subunit
LTTFRRLCTLLHPHRWSLLLCALLSLFTAAALLAIPAAVKEILAGAIGDTEAESALPLGWILAGILIVLPLSTFTVSYVMLRISHRVAARLRSAYAQSLLRVSMSFHRTHRIGETLDRIAAGLREIERFVQAHLVGTLGTVVLLAGALVMMFLLSWRLALVVVVAVPLIGVGLRPLHRRVSRTVRETAVAAAGLTDRIHEALVGIEVVKAFDAEPTELGRLHRQQQHLLDVQRRGARYVALMEPLLLTSSVAIIVVVLIYSGRLLARGALRPEELVAFILYSIILIPQSRAITPLVVAWQQLTTALQRLDDIIQLPPEAADGQGRRLREPVRGEIRFEGVTHSYADRERALADVSFSVAPEETVGIVGMSGAGKSTLFNLLLRFYEPTEGRILLDGEDISTLNASAVRRAISIVPQDTVLFDGSIEDNVRYGRPEASTGEVRAACRAARLESFMEALPEGYSTRVGGRGLKLSGGQRQRLAIARALLKNSPILLLDEATSQLDTQTERDLQEAVRAATHGRTTLIIAHRLATVIHLPRILVMDGGRIVDHGTHDELLGRSALYQDLVATQLDLVGGQH